MTTTVLYQREINPDWDEPARVVSVMEGSTEVVLDASLKKVMPGYRAYVIAFKNLPPEKLLLNACDEAVRRGTVVKLPVLAGKRSIDLKMFRKTNLKQAS